MAVTEAAAVVSTAKNAADTLERLGVLEKLKAKLIGDPDRAARHLVRVLVEIENVYQELERQILNLSTLEFRPAREFTKSKNYLRRLKNHGLKKQISEARAACKQIKVIHRRWLSGWFARVLDEQEARELQRLFDDMSIMDDSLVGVMWGLSDRLCELAEKILEQMDQDGPKAAKSARDIIAAEEKNLDATLQNLNTELAKLGELKAEFLAVAQALSD